jgi:hypothetical protein
VRKATSSRAAELAALARRLEQAKTVGEAGDLLLKAKAKLPHGQWLAWLAENVTRFPGRTARRYVSIAARQRPPRRPVSHAQVQREIRAIVAAWDRASPRAQALFALHWGEKMRESLRIEYERGMGDAKE